MILTADNLRKRRITYVSWCLCVRDQVKMWTPSLSGSFSVMEKNSVFVWYRMEDARHSKRDVVQLEPWEEKEEA